MRKGFTLVELSIVLVIIGLLIGGILVAQSMIDTAKINSFISRMQQVEIAVSNFKEKYKCLPGDSNKHSPGGDCDQSLEPATSDFTGEIANFWVHLNQDDFYPDGRGTSYTATVTGEVRAKINVPEAGLEQGFMILAVNNWSTDVNMYYVTKLRTGQGEDLDGVIDDTAGEGIPAGTAYSVDAKLDDGLPQSGNIKGIMWDTIYGAWDETADTLCNESSNNVYAASDGECQIIFKMLGSY